MPYSSDNSNYSFSKVLDNKLKLCVLDEYHYRRVPLKSCVSITINKGHFHAQEFPEGLVHLFEHMLFSASERFPNPKQLDEHLFGHQGQFNAWTQDEAINIQLSCEHNGFLLALDILLDRLCFPLFNKKDIKHEISVLDAEFNSKKTDPLRGLLSVQKATCNPCHPYSRFSSGNAQTLSQISTEQTQNNLFSFHKSSIQGHNIGVCVGISQDKIDEDFFKQIINKFNQIPGNADIKGLLKEKWPAIYKDEHLKKLIKIEQFNMAPQLVVSYIIKAFSDEDRDSISSSYLMLSHLLESKHKHGLFYVLKQKNLIEDISCDFKHLDSVNDEFFVNIKLKKHTTDNVYHILAIVQKYISYLHSTGIENWRFREKSKQYELATKLERPAGLLEQCINISQWLLQNTKNKHHDNYLNLNNELVFKDLVVKHILRQLKPFQKRVYYISDQELSCSEVKVTPHYNVKYTLCSLEDSAKTKTDLVLEKPRQNPYMPNEIRICKQSLKQYEPIIRKSEKLTFKFFQHTQFNTPTGECYISLSDPTMGTTAQQINIKRAWVDCVQKTCSTLFFDAHLASLHHRIYAHKTGVTIHIQGICEKQILFAIELLNLVLNFKASSQDIESALSLTDKQSSQVQQFRPLNQMFNKLIEIYQPDKINNSTIQGVANTLSLSEVLEFQNHYFETCHLECLLLGNWSVEHALKLCSLIESRMKGRKAFKKELSYAKPFTTGVHVHTKLKTSSNVVVWHYTPFHADELVKEQATFSIDLLNKVGARAIILERLLSFTVFDVIRHKYKMGYSLGVGYKPIGKLPGVAMYVESTSHSEKEIFEALMEVLSQSISLLNTNKFNFDKLKKDLIRQVTPEDKSLRQVANRAWLHFDDENPLLGYLNLVNALNSTKLQDIEQSLSMLQSSSKYQVLTTLSANNNSNIQHFD